MTMLITDLGLRRALANATGGANLHSPPSEFDARSLSTYAELSWSSDSEAEQYSDAWAAISNLSGIEACSRLRIVGFVGNAISNLEPLRACRELQDLSLGGNAIRDLAPIAELPKLRRLSLWDNPVATVEPLRKARALERLDLTGTAVVDIRPLLDLAELRELTMLRSAPLPDEQIDVLCALRARGVSVNVSDELRRRIDTAAARKAPAGASSSDSPRGIAMTALERAGLVDLAATLRKQGPGGLNGKGETILHRIAARAGVGTPADAQVLADLIPLVVRAGVDPLAEEGTSGDTALAATTISAETLPVFTALVEVTPNLNVPEASPPLARAWSRAWSDRGDGPRSAHLAGEQAIALLEARGASATLPAVVVQMARAGQWAPMLRALDAGASIDATSGKDTLLRCATRRDDLAIMRELFDRGANARLLSPIGLARSAAAARLLEEYGAALPINAGAERHPLHVLCETDALSKTDSALAAAKTLVDLVVERQGTPDVLDRDGETPLLVLARHSYADDACVSEFAKYLIERGADIEHRSFKGESALDVSRRARAFLKELKAKKGAAIASSHAKALEKAKAWTRGHDTWRILRSVAARDEWAQAKNAVALRERAWATLSADHGAYSGDVRATDSLAIATEWAWDGGKTLDPSGQTLLHRLVRLDDASLRRRLVVAAIGRGADVSLLTNGHTALGEWLSHKAWSAPDDEVFLALTTRETATDGLECLLFSSERFPKDTRDDYVQRLIESGADLSAPRVFQRIVQCGDVELVARALDAGAALCDGDFSPLVDAIKKERLTLARLLLDHGANANGTHPWRPLAFARSREAIDLLLERGADINARGGLDSEAALHELAAASEYEGFPSGGYEAIERLIELGADVRAENRRGQTPLALLAKSFDPRGRALALRLA